MVFDPGASTGVCLWVATEGLQEGLGEDAGVAEGLQEGTGEFAGACRMTRSLKVCRSLW